MSITVLIHMLTEDPIIAEIEKVPDPADQFLTCENPRRRDGRDLSYVLPDLRGLIIPWHRIQSVELLPSDEEEQTISFVRE